MMKELIEQGYGTDLKLNCAEKILYSANEVYNLGLDSEALKLAAGFGGGMAIESTCGALTGGVMVLGKLFKPINKTKEENEYFRGIIKSFLDAFRKDMNNIDCAPLKKEYRTEEKGCNGIILKAAEVLEMIINKELEKAKKKS
ncbi:C-GCAxxG-C-C family (seleno)protein [Sporosalibacterium faouarense]|uniref:C-GCAxxG-C-C family (seleno)protein n=1 Tax=Sporosalibacterium faouarense TaxID=516123 RepID=UPI00141C2FC8|nr:C-GCAxxG-C-C family (seleno)protein [Sporosalibacterium faouarense]MTI47379.1 hypothetical protein [Bacillota bacterium]